MFPRSANGRLGYAKPFRAALKASGITNFRFHDLRHSAASYLAMNGATTAEFVAVLGHNTLQMVKRYARLTDQHTSAAVARMNEVRLYSFKVDRLSGDVLPDVVDQHNHLIDAPRYALAPLIRNSETGLLDYMRMEVERLKAA